MKTELRPMLDYGVAESAELMNLGFADYFVPVELTLQTFLQMARVQSIDLIASRVIALDAEPVGIALIARRGWTSRLATMCLIPAARGHGVGRTVMNMLMSEAAGRGERSMVLEVIETNAPAIRLYEAVGFRTERRLLSYAAEFPVGENRDTASLEEIDIREAADWVTCYGLPNLPWQIAGESLAQLGPPLRAFRMNDACLVISSPSAEQVGVRSIIVKPEARNQKRASQIMQAAVAKYPDKKWLVSPHCPEEIGGFFEQVGFTLDKLSQLQMRAAIEQPPAGT